VTVSVPVSSSLTIEAYATTAGLSPSGVVSATYYTVVTPTWENPNGGNWSSTNNWLNTVVANGIGWAADFSTLTLPGDGNVDLDVPATVGSLVFGDQGNAYNWIVGSAEGNALTLNAGTNRPLITVVNTNTTISAVLAGANGMVKAGAGTLTLSAVNTFLGGTTVSNGTLVLDLTANTTIAIGSNYVSPAGTLELYNINAIIDGQYPSTGAITGSGTLVKTGNGYVDFVELSIGQFAGQILV